MEVGFPYIHYHMFNQHKGPAKAGDLPFCGKMVSSVDFNRPSSLQK